MSRHRGPRRLKHFYLLKLRPEMFYSRDWTELRMMSDKSPLRSKPLNERNLVSTGMRSKLL